MIRAFVAIPLPEENQLRIKDTIETLRRLNLDARFPAVESVHLTLKFLGNIEEADVPAIASALDECCQTQSPFPVHLNGLGAFPHSANPRVIWMSVRAGRELDELQQLLETQLVDLGFEAEERPFRPHLTVARVKSRKNLKELLRLLSSAHNNFSAGSFQVKSAALYRSELKPSGAVYSILHQFFLKEGPAE
ncbi:MAG TPA: RNA 2',3'-cyclic phosphodiesterase [Acidobacteriota bacterium]|nr:RNA 2',3'-cyclic phosphodiesterase [Acidobacteriota bacterium]